MKLLLNYKAVQKVFESKSPRPAVSFACNCWPLQIAGHTSLNSVGLCAEGIRTRSHRELPLEVC